MYKTKNYFVLKMIKYFLIFCPMLNLYWSSTVDRETNKYSNNTKNVLQVDFIINIIVETCTVHIIVLNTEY